MEKLEYKARLDEMQHYVSVKNFQEAIAVGNSINWRKVHNINDLVIGSEAYEAAGAALDARDLLEMAHERSPIGRTILYKLCMISIKLKEFDEAEEYYNEFVQIAPHDSLKYILRYNLGVAKEEDTATLIKILEQLKEDDFLEEWAYELAYLYHKTNQADKCIDLCDELILWFGDGPIVERALELKMLYQPLDKSQEIKYRHFQQKKDGITEITAGEKLDSGEIVSHNMSIPSVDISAEKFNTINLQAEIKKNIDEIMNATEKGAVSDNIEQIKNLVEEIPYLQVKEEPIEDVKDDFSVNDTFNAYLAEDSDGQMNLLLPDDEPEKEEQIEGQMTIEDVLADWERTKRAAEAAMEDAKNKELENAKAKALREANSVLNRLEGAMSKLDAGMTSSELLHEEYMQKKDEEVEAPVVKEDDNAIQEEYLPSLEDYSAGFAIPKLHDDGSSDGSVDIPRISNDEIKKSSKQQNPASSTITKEPAKKEAPSWQPPTLEEGNNEEVDFKEASMMIADVNKILQGEIDRLQAEPQSIIDPISKLSSGLEDLPKVTLDTIVDGPIIKPDIYNHKKPIPQPIEDEYKIEDPADTFDITKSDNKSANDELISKIEELAEDVNDDNLAEADTSTDSKSLQFEEKSSELETASEISEENTEDVSKDNNDEIEIDSIEIQLPEIELPADLFEQDEYSQEDVVPVEKEEGIKSAEKTAEEETKKSVDIINEEVKPEEKKEEKISVEEISLGSEEQFSDVDITDEDLEIFSYFLSIRGMKNAIMQTVSNLIFSMSTNSMSANLAIIGEEGYGKTTLATNIIELLKEKTGKPVGQIGTISGDKLNSKDIQRLFNKIQGGALIIEKAGSISKQTAVTLSLLMESDKDNTLVILEDTKKGMDKAFLTDATFAKRFSERIAIPVFSIDELVLFAKQYAADEGFTFDEMGVLALYNRINLIARYDHATSLREVVDIMEDAMDNSSKGGFFNKVKYDKQGNIILKEKDFEN